MFVLTLAASPSANSRSARLLGRARDALAVSGIASRHLELHGLPAEALLHANTRDPLIVEAIAAVAQADAIIIATPVYKASYSGLLKVFLDLLPQDAFGGKLILPIASGGSLAHALVIDYALRPVLNALGAHDALPGIFAIDKDIETLADGTLAVAPALLERLTRRVGELRERLPHTPHAAAA